jgi:C4-dicarboxylate-binding protein DctP
MTESLEPTSPPATATREQAEPVASPDPDSTPEASADESEPTAVPTTAVSPGPSAEEALTAYAAERANGPGAIFVGDPAQLIGPPPHEGLMFGIPMEQYNLMAGAALLGSPELQVPSHMFIYTSDYYQGLIQKANLSNPTELESSGEDITIQHVCLDRQLPPCVLIQAYLAPNIARRTNGQVNISVISLVELSIDGQDTLTQVSDGTLDMVNIFTGYVAGEVPALEIQSLWGSAPDWETSYLTLTELAEDVDRLIPDSTGGSRVFNRNWFAGSDQWFFSENPLQTVADYKDLKIRSNSSSMSDFIRGMDGKDEFTSIAELYTSLDQGVVDVAVYGALLAVSARLHEVTDYMSGPIIGFGYTNNVINKDVWSSIPSDLQQIMIEEGAMAELEGLRLAPFQNVAAVQINVQLGMSPILFSEEIYQHIQNVVLPEHVIPGWVRRLGFPDKNADIVAVYNGKASPYSGVWINDDGSTRHVPITSGPRAGQ